MDIQKDKLLYIKWPLAEIKFKLLNVVCSLLDDELYSIEDAVKGLIEIVDIIELHERG